MKTVLSICGLAVIIILGSFCLAEVYYAEQLPLMTKQPALTASG